MCSQVVVLPRQCLAAAVGVVGVADADAAEAAEGNIHTDRQTGERGDMLTSGP